MHEITNPNAPPGWRCGDPLCRWHGTQSVFTAGTTHNSLYRDVMAIIDRVDMESVDEVFARWEGRPPRSFAEIDEALR